MSPEDLFCHGTLKTEIVRALAGRVKTSGIGHLFTDSTRVSCPAADMSVEPDVVLVTEDSLDSGRVRLIGKTSGEPDRYVELEGPPDLIVEIVSDSSVKKDTQRLPAVYFQAGVAEFWLVDARAESLVFRIHRRGQSKYEPAESDAQGFQCSAAMGCWFRLDRARNARGRVVFDLRHKGEKASS